MTTRLDDSSGRKRCVYGVLPESLAQINLAEFQCFAEQTIELLIWPDIEPISKVVAPVKQLWPLVNENDNDESFGFEWEGNDHRRNQGVNQRGCV